MQTYKIFKYILLIITVFSIVSCSRHLVKKEIPKENYVFYPPKPDTARFQFLTSIDDSRFVSQKKESKFKKFVTGEETKIKSIVSPYGIKIFNGKLYVIDTGVRTLIIIDLNKGIFEYFVPSTKEAAFSRPTNCYVDNNGFLYIVDMGRNEVLIFDFEQSFIGSIKLDEKFVPADVSVYEDKIFVANLADHKINVFKNDTSRKLLYSFPDIEVEDEGFLRQPKNITVRDDRIYISDFGNFDVKVYKTNGEYLKSIGSQGMSPGHFARPKGIAVDKESNVFVIDAAFGNAQIFNKDSQLLMYFGSEMKKKPGEMYMPANIIIDYNNLNYFEKYVNPDYNLNYLIFVSNQYGPAKINVYGRVEQKKKNK